MAIRYSGDVEIRLLHKGGRIFTAVVRTPRDRWAQTVKADRSYRTVTPDDYDHVAIVVLSAFRTKYSASFPCEHDSVRVQIRRVFQAPCPMRKT